MSMLAKFFKSTLLKNPTCAPTEVELHEAIEKALSENPKNDTKGIRSYILKQNSSWRVSKRRINRSVSSRSATLQINSTEDNTKMPMVSAAVFSTAKEVGHMYKGNLAQQKAIFRIEHTPSADGTEDMFLCASFSDGDLDTSESETTQVIRNPCPFERNDDMLQIHCSVVPDTETEVSQEIINDKNISSFETALSDKDMNAEFHAFAYSDDNDWEKERVCRNECKNVCIIL